jgi:DNA (cytosine-5)-methyltransferase 1
MRVGSLCTGYGGLDLALGGETVFVSEIDPHANTVLAQRFPGVPNLGDFTVLDSLPECDVLTAGFPCQPVSQAGKRAGTDDERWLWDDIERVVGGMGRPPAVLFLENVRGLLTANGGDAMGRVVSGLARLGYVGSYRVVSAADVGACHRRERVFIVAAHTEQVRRGSGTGLRPGEGPEGVARFGWGRSGDDSGEDAARAERVGREGAVTGTLRHDSGSGPRFGPYGRAVARWERIIGRPAPDPTVANTDSARRRQVTGSVRGDASGSAGWSEEHDHQPGGVGEERDGPGAARLNPRFVEWMMGLPDGWVCDTGVSRTAQLKILGNGVVPQQARAAWHMLTS